MPTKNLLDAYEIKLTFFGTRFDDASYIRNLNNLIRGRLRNPSAFPNARITMKGDSFVVSGVPQQDLQRTLDGIRSTSPVHGWSFEYELIPKQLSPGEVLDLMQSYISGIEKQVLDGDAKITGLERANAGLEQKLKEATAQASLVQGEIKLLKARMGQPPVRVQAPDAGTANITYTPKINPQNLADILSAAATFVRLADQQLEFYAQLGFNPKEKFSAPPKPKEYLEERLGVKGETPADFVENLTRSYERGWLRSFTAFRRASKEVMSAMNDYSIQLARYTLLSAFREADVKFQIVSVSDSKSVHYYIPRGSNKGEFSKSLRDSVLDAAARSGAQASTEKAENMYRISVPKEAAAQLESHISQNPNALWKNIGVSVFFSRLPVAEA